jgi:uncharacterized membrane protein YbhN (UPF0104 family)
LKNTIIKILKIIIPLGIGVYLSWFFYANLSRVEKEGIPKAFANANYFWVLLSLVVAWISHFSRAYRWKYQLEHLGYKPKTSSMYHSVMIGYIINLTVPRSGEFARAGFFSKKENIPFDKAFGTIVAERVIDVIMLLAIMGITTLYVGGEVIDDITKPKFEEKVLITESISKSVFGSNYPDEDGNFEWKVVDDFSEKIKKDALILYVNGKKVKNLNIYLNEHIGKTVTLKGKPPVQSKSLLYGIIIGVFVMGLLIFLFVTKIRNLLLDKLKGLWEGVKSIFFLKKRVAFIFHTFLIWTCYLAMFWICALGVDGVSEMGLDAVLVCFVVGGVAMTATPGGIGLYPLFVTAALVYFGFNKGDASGFSILMWSVQTVFLVVFGLYSLFAINVKFTAADAEADKKMLEE